MKPNLIPFVLTEQIKPEIVMNETNHVIEGLPFDKTRYNDHIDSSLMLAFSDWI